jgi:DNA polymerase-3 subunit epsilon
MTPREFAVLDFETTGLSADCCRVIEVAAAIVRDGHVVDSFVQLMHPGHRIPWLITDLTGITDAMVKGQPRPEAVMPALRDFLGGRCCVAHNASFDAGFYHAEMGRAGIAHERTFFCTMKLSRRLIQDAPNHQLGSLVHHLNLPRPSEGSSHRAFYDTLLTVELWNRLDRIVSERLGGKAPDPEMYQAIMKKPKAIVWKYLETIRSRDEAATRHCCATARLS